MKRKLLLFVFLLTCSAGIKAQWISQFVPFSSTAYFFDIETTGPLTMWGNPLYVSGTTASTTRDFFLTTDGGVTWPSYGVMTGTPANYRVSNIWPIDAQTCYAAMYSATATGGNVYKTVNGGLNWTTTGAYNASSTFPNFVYFYGPAHGVTMGDQQGGYHEIYTTSDSGATWTRTASLNIPLPLAADDYGTVNRFTTAQGHIWFATTYGSIYHSADSGLTWTSSASGFPANINATTSDRNDVDDLAFIDSLHGIIVNVPYDTLIAGKGPFIKSTSDGGATWNAVTYSGPIYIADFDVVTGSSVYISAGSNNTYGFGTSYSMDNGVTWSVLDVSNSHTAIDFFDPTHGFTGEVVQPFTSGLWQYDSGLGPVGLAPLADNKLSVELYPNPTNGIVNYNFKAGQQSNVKITVYSSLGQAVYEKDFGKVSGMFSETLDLQNFAKGMYIVHLLNGTKLYQQKVIVQ